MPKLDLLVTVAEPRRVQQVANMLQNQGLDVTRTWPRSGTISVIGDSSMIRALEAVEGVQSVRQARRTELPPMGEDIPQ